MPHFFVRLALVRSSTCHIECRNFNFSATFAIKKYKLSLFYHLACFYASKGLYYRDWNHILYWE